MSNILFLRKIVSTLLSAGITEIIPNISVNIENVRAYLSIVEENYPEIDAILASTESANNIHSILVAIANGNDNRFEKAFTRIMLPLYTEAIYDTLNGANIDIGMSCDMLQSHIKEANKDFPGIDIAGTIILMDSPYCMKQAIDSIIACDNNKLKQYLDFISNTYCSE